MSFEYLIDPENGPRWKGLLPGKPAPYVLRRGEGEHAMLFGDLFTVLLSGDETNGQFGVITSECPPGQLIPTHVHSGTHETFSILEGKVRLFFQADLPRMRAAARQHNMQLPPDYQWPMPGEQA